MAYRTSTLVISTVALLVAAPAAGQSENTADEQRQEQAAREILAMPWIADGKGAVGGVASIAASNQARVLTGAAVDRFVNLSGNLPEPGATIVAPKDLHWFSMYEYRDVGYVTDKDAIDADDLLRSLKKNQEQANSERQQRGLDTFNIIGWAVPPHYDVSTHNLEWGLEARSSSGDDTINYTTRHLGRGGYVSSVLVTAPETFNRDLEEFRASDAKLAFSPGNTYAEWRQGDKVAGYGLAALIVGGAGAAVVKSGAGKGIAAGLIAFWKFIAAGVVAAFAAAGKFFRRIFGRAQED